MVIILSLAALAASPQAQEPLGWLVGIWCTEPKDGAQTCERWKPMVGATMTGVTEIRKADGTVIEEKMSIFNDAGRLVFHAEPKGQAPADFDSEARDYNPSKLTFLNRAHDYPQRVRYWREGALLMAEISLADGSKPMRWAYHRVKR